MVNRIQYDWDAIEGDYRAGMISIRQMAREYDVPEGTIRSRAKKHGWERDLAGAIRTAVAIKLVREGVSGAGKVGTDAEIVEANAVQAVGIVRRERQSVSDAHAAAAVALARLLAALKDKDELELAVLEETASRTAEENEDPRERAARLRRRQLLMDTIGLGAHLSHIGSMAAILKSVIPLERIVFGIDKPGGDSPRTQLEQLYDNLKGHAFRPVELPSGH